MSESSNQPRERRLLIVDDEENISRAMVRLLRRDGYTIFTANSGQQGLDILKTEPIAVIISDQRMPQMSGVEFVSEVYKLYPDTIRIVLSGYTDLETITEAINRGAIYKFYTKPWDDDLLRENIRHAFDEYELKDENRRLSKELTKAHLKLQKSYADTSQSLEVNIHVLQLVQNIFDKLPLAIIGVDDRGNIAVTNQQANTLLNGNGILHGNPISDVIPSIAVDQLLDVETDRPYQTTITIADGTAISLQALRLSMSGDTGGVILLLGLPTIGQ